MFSALSWRETLFLSHSIREYCQLSEVIWDGIFCMKFQAQFWEQSWSWSYGSWNYNCLYLSPLMLWVRIPLRVRCTTLCDKVCQWLAAGRWFSPGTPQFPPPIKLTWDKKRVRVEVMVFNATFNNISAISWRWTMVVQHQVRCFQLYHGENKLLFDEMKSMSGLVLKPTSWDLFQSCQLIEIQNSSQIDMSPIYSPNLNPYVDEAHRWPV
jgi:hypothetical protein